MIQRSIRFIESKKSEKILACTSYIGIIGLFMWIALEISNGKDEEKLIYFHAKNSSFLFLISIFALPFAKLINRFYFYLLNPFLNILLLNIFLYVIYKKIKGIQRAKMGLI